MSDPNAALQGLRDALAEREVADTDQAADQAAHEAADAAQALIEWLAKGGFPPNWKRVPATQGGHTISWRIESDGGIVGKAVCHEPQGADCRTYCARFCDVGHRDARNTCVTCGGPLVLDGECNPINWILNGDGWQWHYGGNDGPLVDGPIVFAYEDDDWSWTYAETNTPIK